MSVVITVIVSLVTVTTLFLGTFGIINYKLDKDREWSNLREELHLIAAQLSLSLSLPVWNYDTAQAKKIIESAMNNLNIYYISLKIDNNTSIIRGRDINWEITIPEHNYLSDGLLSEARAVILPDKSSTEVQVFVTTKFIEKKLKKFLIMLISIIPLLDIIIVLSLYFVLWASVLKPLMKIEQFATSVSSGYIKDVRIPGTSFQRELDSLRNSIEKMVVRHNDYLKVLQNEVKLHRESEERFKTIFNSVNDAIIIHDRDTGAILDVNDKMCEMYGYSREEALNINVGLISSGVNFYTQGEAVKAIKLQNNDMLTRQWQAKHKDGRIFWVENTMKRAVIDRVERVIVVIRDIDERKKAEKALQLSEEKYREIFDRAIDGIFQSTPAGKYININPSFARMFGYESPEEMISMIKDIEKQIYFNSEDRKQFAKILEEAGKTENFEMQSVKKDGTKFWTSLNARIVHDIDGNIQYYEGTIKDITERKQAEEELVQLLSILDRSINEIYLFNADTLRFNYVNSGATRNLGYSHTELEKITLLDIMPEFTEESFHTQIKPLMEHKDDKHIFKTIHRRADGTLYPVEVHLQLVVQDEKQIFLSVVIDITERIRIEEEMERLQSQLRQAQKMEAIGTLAGGVAHDFNNILTVITGYATLMRMEMDKDNLMQKYVDHILSAAEKAMNLTHQLLAFSRKQPVELKPVNLNGIIKGIENLLKRLLTEDITLTENIIGDDLPIMGDANQIDHILFNLATNARDAMPKGGKLTIETKRVELNSEFTDFLGYGIPGTYALLSFSDTGIGMDDKTKEHIFDPFFTTKEVGKGTGLGLSTVYGLVKQHNGYITVYTEPGFGSTFHIYFPISETSVEKKEEAQKAVRHLTGGDETILVVEDNESVRLFIKTILTRFGYTIIEAVDGQDAIDKFIKFQGIDLMLTDLVMPKKNGKEVYYEIIKINPDIKAIFMSGYTKDIVLDKGFEENEVEFISKPLTPDALIQKVRTVLDKR